MELAGGADMMDPARHDSKAVRQRCDSLRIRRISNFISLFAPQAKAAAAGVTLGDIEGRLRERFLEVDFEFRQTDHEGEMVGFAYFRLLGTEGGSEKVIRGYFVSPINAEDMTINPTAPGATLDTGVYVIKLTN